MLWLEKVCRYIAILYCVMCAKIQLPIQPQHGQARTLYCNNLFFLGISGYTGIQLNARLPMNRNYAALSRTALINNAHSFSALLLF